MNRRSGWQERCRRWARCEGRCRPADQSEPAGQLLRLCRYFARLEGPVFRIGQQGPDHDRALTNVVSQRAVSEDYYGVAQLIMTRRAADAVWSLWCGGGPNPTSSEDPRNPTGLLRLVGCEGRFKLAPLCSSSSVILKVSALVEPARRKTLSPLAALAWLGSGMVVGMHQEVTSGGGSEARFTEHVKSCSCSN